MGYAHAPQAGIGRIKACQCSAFLIGKTQAVQGVVIFRLVVTIGIDVRHAGDDIQDFDDDSRFLLFPVTALAIVVVQWRLVAHGETDEVFHVLIQWLVELHRSRARRFCFIDGQLYRIGITHTWW